MRRSAKPRSVTALAALLLGATGCTICPDPFDYCGPVPDGSAPQNDFHLRANGIIPRGSHPVPWPPVVQASPRPDSAPRSAVADAEPAAAPGPSPGPADVADDVADHVAADVAADVRPVAAAEPDETVDADADSPQPVAGEPDVIPVPDEPGFDVILPPTAPPRPEILPPLRETPGWNPRG